MKVYRVEAFGQPPGKKFKNYAQLSCNESDEKFLDSENFSGKPFPRKWRRVKLFFEEPLWPRADFYYLGSSNFVCSNRVKRLLGELMGQFGEFLPVSIEEEVDTHYIYNVTNLCPLIDPVKSIWKCSVKCKEELENPMSGLLQAPSFNERALGENWVFKIPETDDIYCLERVELSPDKQFKAIVEKNGLVGLRFDLVIGPL